MILDKTGKVRVYKPQRELIILLTRLFLGYSLLFPAEFLFSIRPNANVETERITFLTIHLAGRNRYQKSGYIQMSDEE